MALQTDGLMARLDRQSIHTREDPPMPMLWFVIDEAVLIRPIGGRQVMQEQTGRLIEASLLPKVVLQVIQLGSGRTRDCPASSR